MKLYVIWILIFIASIFRIQGFVLNFQIDEFSGDDQIVNEASEKRNNVIRFEIEVKLNAVKNFHVEINVYFYQNFIFGKFFEFEVLKTALEKYVTDLCNKHSTTKTRIEVRAIKIGSDIIGVDQYPMKFECLKDSKYIDECESIVQIFVTNFNVNEFLIYFHEIGYLENVNMIEGE